jgi:hypothetical protein
VAQHLWHEGARTRRCEVCMISQFFVRGEWSPPISAICPGDDEDGGRRRAGRRPKPLVPAGSPPVLEDA